MHQRALGLSQWTMTAAGASSEQPERPIWGQLWATLGNCVELFSTAVLVRPWLKLAGRHSGLSLEGLFLSVFLPFCCNFFFSFKGHVLQSGPSSQHHVCVGVKASLWDSPHICPLGRRVLGKGLVLSSSVRKMVLPLRASLNTSSW